MLSDQPDKRASTTSGFALKDIVVSLLINVGVPLLIIYVLMTSVHTSEFVALSVASVVPIGYSIMEIVRHRRVDLIGLFFLLGIVTNIAATFAWTFAYIRILRRRAGMMVSA